MSAAILFNYPEFLVALLLSVCYFLLGAKKNAKAAMLPSWLTEPATAAISCLPPSYVGWLGRLQTYSGWRTNTAFGALSSAKFYPPCLVLFSAVILPVPAAIALSLLSFFVPDVIMIVLSKRRQQQIRDALPNALDLMILCVDAGLGLDATLQRTAQERTPTGQALNDELMTLSRDVVLGMDRERAYQELYNRSGVEELKSFASSLNQSAKLGLSIAKNLRNQAEFQRTKLSQKAEERSARLPIYMAFPLWFCIMPALMVILLAPSLIVFFENAPH
ncbi:MAG: type II secretion system F family protein [Candidatus Melainabacteria bacterium]|nr:type II secretion system F family protein [Candidatus Melainabacteria bacterium]